jgi:glycerate 2-kinase
VRVVLAPDSFKESMSATRAARAMAAGVLAAHPEAVCVLRPMADGGEGTVAALLGGWDDRSATAARRIVVPVLGPLGAGVEAELAWLPERRVAVIESASAVGVDLVPPGARDVLRADSGGVGTLVRAALDLRAERIVLGLGGTLTSDGGAGLLRELGVRVLDRHGEPLPPGVPLDVATLDATDLDPRLARARIDLACDVANPLLGPEGAAAVFAPQKGATPEQVPIIEAALSRMAGLLDGVAVRVGSRGSGGSGGSASVAGGGAAGGLGAALLALGARMRPGVQVVAEAVGLAEAIAGADLVLTGEGRVDRQTLAGKVPSGVSALARAAGVPVIVLGGGVDSSADLSSLGARAVHGIADGLPLAEALRRGPELLTAATARVLRDLAT